jgi:hypothetical protein
MHKMILDQITYHLYITRPIPEHLNELHEAKKMHG